MKTQFKMVGPNSDETNFERDVQQHLNRGWNLHGPVMIVRSAAYTTTDYYVQAMIKTPSRTDCQ